MLLYLKTRTKDLDYRFISEAPNPWWEKYSRWASFEDGVVLVERNGSAVDWLISGIPSMRHDASGRIIRFTLVGQIELNDAKNIMPVLSAGLTLFLHPDSPGNLLGNLLDDIFPESKLESRVLEVSPAGPNDLSKTNHPIDFKQSNPAFTSPIKKNSPWAFKNFLIDDLTQLIQKEVICSKKLLNKNPFLGEFYKSFDALTGGDLVNRILMLNLVTSASSEQAVRECGENGVHLFWISIDNNQEKNLESRCQSIKPSSQNLSEKGIQSKRSYHFSPHKIIFKKKTKFWFFVSTVIIILGALVIYFLVSRTKNSITNSKPKFLLHQDYILLPDSNKFDGKNNSTNSINGSHFSNNH